ncbi:MAG: hypothetical protein ICV60_18105 [Pyrinomonadaceae bacterium]|nr:hypothetical protein [Pyrinomonadaceae bacterium]
MAKSVKKRHVGSKAGKAVKAASVKTKAAQVKAAAKTYEICTTFPGGEPTIRLIFHGLFCFCFDGKNSCEIGIPNITQDILHPHPQPHDFNIAVWRKDSGTCPPVPMSVPIVDPKLMLGRVTLNVIKLPLEGVCVYQKDKNAFDRNDLANNDSRDWRWVLDIEGDIYTQKVTKDPSTLRPSMTINEGLFYTVYPTNSTFHLHPSGAPNINNDRDVGHMAEIVGANIYLDQNEIAVLTIPTIASLPHVFTFAGGTTRTYQIDVTNNCRRGVQECRFDPNSTHVEERNDFYLYYETFTEPAGQPKFELITTSSTRSTYDPGRLGICSEKHSKPGIDSNDETPCGATVFGQSRNPG